MNDETLNVVRVITSAIKTPEVESKADARIASGRGKASELKQQDDKNQNDGQS